MSKPFFSVSSPESLGIPSASISAFVDGLDALEQAHAFILMRQGKIAAEGAWHPYSLELPHELFSLSKSFISCAIGIAREEKLLSLDDRIVDFFPEYLSPAVSPGMRLVTLRDLLRMASGHDRCSFGFVKSRQGDWLRQILESPLLYPPGEHFVYNSGGTFLLSAVIHRVTGMNPVEYLQPRLFDPMGIAAPEWNCCPQGINIGGWGLWLPPTDIAKFGQLLLQQGNWEGKQLVPAGYLREATSFQIDNSMNGNPDWKVGYGYQFWRCRQNGFRGDGACGQYAVVYPEHQLVFAFVSGLSNMQNVLTLLQEKVLPYLGEDPLAEDPEALAELRKRTAALKASLPAEMEQGAEVSPLSGTVAGEYAVVDNPWDIRSLRVHFPGDECVLETDSLPVRAGFRNIVYSEAALSSAEPHRIAARAAWVRPDELMIYAWCLQTPSRFTWRLRFCGNDVTVHRTAPIIFNDGRKNLLFHAVKQPD